MSTDPAAPLESGGVQPQEAHASLRAAAPDLYEACLSMLAELDYLEATNAPCIPSRAAYDAMASAVEKVLTEATGASAANAALVGPQEGPKTEVATRSEGDAELVAILKSALVEIRDCDVDSAMRWSELVYGFQEIAEAALKRAEEAGRG